MSCLIRQLLLLILSCSPLLALESPQQLLALKMQTRLLTQTTGTMTGEGPAWHAAWRAHDFVRFARETGDVAYVDAAATYFDALIAKLHTSPDGRQGWVGPYIYDESVVGDVHVADAILVNPMLSWVEHVRSLPATEQERLEPAIERYVELAEHVCAKWIARGTWWESGHTGGYITWDQFLAPHDLTQFTRPEDVRNASLGLQFNKQQSMGIVHLRLYRLTGNEAHRRRAQLIFQHARSRLTLFDDHYTWNYWEPFYPGDIVSVDPAKLKLWVATHPHRNYQSGEVSEFVEAFHSGIVFSVQDMRRLVRTNRRMWNGDLDAPSFTNSDVAVTRSAVPDYVFPVSDEHGRAGTVWGALAEFDSTLAKIHGTQATNTAFRRRYDLPVTEFDWPDTEARFLSMVCVVPPAGVSGVSRYLASKSRVAGHVRIVLTDGSGQQELTDLYSGDTPGGVDGLEGILVREWPANLASGSYRVRWMFRSLDGDVEHRDYRITVD